MFVEYSYCASLKGQIGPQKYPKTIASFLFNSKLLYNPLFLKYTTYDTTLCFYSIWVSISVQTLPAKLETLFATYSIVSALLNQFLLVMIFPFI